MLREWKLFKIHILLDTCETPHSGDRARLKHPYTHVVLKRGIKLFYFTVNIKVS